MRLSSQVRKRKFVESVEFPRWIVAVGVLLIGFMLLLAETSDRDGNLNNPGIGGYLLIAAVVTIAAAISWIDRKRRSVIKQRVLSLTARILARYKTSSPRRGASTRKKAL